MPIGSLGECGHQGQAEYGRATVEICSYHISRRWDPRVDIMGRVLGGFLLPVLLCYHQSKAMMEFLCFKYLEGTSVEEYHSRFLMLKRFAPGSFTLGRERVVQFISGLCISLK